MASKRTERFFLDRMVAGLNWTRMKVYDGDEPPDFFLDSGDCRVAVEVTRIYPSENSKGSPDAAQEREFERFVSALAEEYFKDERAQAIQVSVTMPPIITSPAVRQETRGERRAQAAVVAQRALAKLRHLPQLGPWEKHEFQVRQRDGRPATFRVLRLPAGAGAERLWEAMNNNVGWAGEVKGQLLQTKVTAKAQDLPKYRATVASAYLLVVADGSRASGFLELPPEVAVDPKGFDAVYFQRYPGATQKVPTL
jgi:hypothetical protein